MCSSLPYYDRETVKSKLEYPALISRLNLAFQKNNNNPLRSHLKLSDIGNRSSELLLMPAWNNQVISIKIVTIFPDNKELPAISGVILIFDAKTGLPLATIDAGEITAKRTAAASALASSFLSRNNSKRLLILGTGRLVPYLAEAHSYIRDLSTISIWGRDTKKAEKTANSIPDSIKNKCQINVVQNLKEEVVKADIISTATRSTAPLIKKEWISSGTHLDLVGGYRKDMREVDDETIKMASIFVDTKVGVIAEAGDIIQPIEKGIISIKDIKADFYDLCQNKHKGRATREEVTLFKSVGCSLEDIVASSLIVDNL